MIQKKNSCQKVGEIKRTWFVFKYQREIKRSYYRKGNKNKREQKKFGWQY